MLNMADKVNEPMGVLPFVQYLIFQEVVSTLLVYDDFGTGWHSKSAKCHRGSKQQWDILNTV